MLPKALFKQISDKSSYEPLKCLNNLIDQIKGNAYYETCSYDYVECKIA